MKNHLDILGTRIDITNLNDASRSIVGWIQDHKKTYVCVAPVATIIDCQKDPQYRAIINNSGMTTPDGMPLVWLGKLAGHHTIQRTYGPDLLLKLCEQSQEKGYRHFFYGATEDALVQLIKKLKLSFPKINIAGFYAPPLRGMDEREHQEVLDQMNQANPDILWVGLGSPKQDYWMARHRDQLNVPVMIGVGAAFDFIAGIKRQAPRWMQRSGLEWFFRLCSEPRRLWKRYLVGNSLFIYLLFRQWFYQKIQKA